VFQAISAWWVEQSTRDDRGVLVPLMFLGTMPRPP
jgi:hypothetical protein